MLTKKTASGAGRTLSNGSGHSRRHSLPLNNGNGCITVPLKETTISGGTAQSPLDNDEFEEEISETAALTAV